MNLYTYISIFVVIITTVILYLILRKNNLKDYRYHIGLGASSLLAIVASLFLPKMMSVFSVDMALHFILSFFIALLVYLTLTLLILMLVAALFPKKKIDKVIEKWNEKKLAKKSAKEEKQKEKQKEKEIRKEEKKKEREKVTPEVVLNDNETIEELEEGKETLEVLFEADENPELSKKEKVTPEVFSEIEQNEHQPENLQTLDKENIYGEEVASVNNEEIVEKEFEQILVNKTDSQDLIENNDSDKSNIIDEAAISLEYSIKNSENIEKNVDTINIIDKMGLDGNFIANESDDIVGEELGIEEMINKAFSLKQEGQETEAVSLYISALNKKPDNETVFLIVLDICAIYKKLGLSKLAEDILLSYIDEFENLMSEDIKDQILESLYS